jgi:hypothetical protein
MKKTYLLAATLVGALTTAPVTTEDLRVGGKDLRADFHALSKVPTTLSAMTAAELDAVEDATSGTQSGGYTAYDLFKAAGVGWLNIRG